MLLSGSNQWNVATHYRHPFHKQFLKCLLSITIQIMFYSIMFTTKETHTCIFVHGQVVIIYLHWTSMVRASDVLPHTLLASHL